MELHKDIFVFHSHFAFELSFNFHFVVTQPHSTVIHFFNFGLANTIPHFFIDNIYLRCSIDNHFNIHFSKLHSLFNPLFFFYTLQWIEDIQNCAIWST
ncbi:unnamed protein product [Meloidogyne enterolobii]|uniref:Uncharacterized protein n=1 Tax=Meloidogyne enterolobii TaxID=390850 RepID=A0ACB0Y381_MELEN